MSAATTDQVRPKWSTPVSAPNEAHTILQNRTIYQGAVAMLVSGKAQPLVAATANSTVLGVALRQYASPSGSDLVLADGNQAIFERGVFPFAGGAGDLPTEAKIGQIVFFGDDNTVQATTPGSPGLGGILRAITEGSYWVEV
jgi:hypothetical protein